mmetsp:Transcript_56383/g.145158  ORF Transcript_56383/g.145158 Transcript_56383/m.145158 type:complete len:243 (+) Transcript_56383:622-1350(+)
MLMRLGDGGLLAASIEVSARRASSSMTFSTPTTSNIAPPRAALNICPTIPLVPPRAMPPRVPRAVPIRPACEPIVAMPVAIMTSPVAPRLLLPLEPAPSASASGAVMGHGTPSTASETSTERVSGESPRRVLGRSPSASAASAGHGDSGLFFWITCAVRSMGTARPTGSSDTCCSVRCMGTDKRGIGPSATSGVRGVLIMGLSRSLDSMRRRRNSFRICRSAVPSVSMLSPGFTRELADELR